MMKKVTAIAVLMVIVLLVACNTAKEKEDHKFHNNPVIAHRGAWKNTGHPQNSIASLRAAIDMGCRGSELDVQLTVDDSLVVYHDLKHHGMVIDSTSYSELIKVPLKNGDKIPTLHEYLTEGIKQHKTKLIIDVKTPKNKDRAVQIAVKALELVQQLGAEEWIEFLAGDLAATDYLLRNTSSPVAYLGQWKNEVEEMNPENVFARGIRYIDYQDIHYKNNPGWIEEFKKEGIHLNVWTVNMLEDMNLFIGKGFDYITTDEPELLLEQINNDK